MCKSDIPTTCFIIKYEHIICLSYFLFLILCETEIIKYVKKAAKQKCEYIKQVEINIKGNSKGFISGKKILGKKDKTVSDEL